MVFISYSHKDEAWKDNVVKHLGVLANDGQLALWDDRRISGGDNWLPEIEKAIHSCDVALLLISADFLTSMFILGKEIPPLLQRREKDGVRVIPVILRPCAWDDVSWLQSIQARPKDGKALTSMTENDAEEALALLTKEVNHLIKTTPTVENPSTPSLRPNYHPSNPVFHVPYATKGNQVIGRDEALSTVRQHLVEGRRTAIGHTVSFKGLGGLGKTQLAVEYAHRYRDSYPNGIIWLNADQEIDAQLTELAVSAQWIAPESDHKDKLDVAKQRLRGHGNCLIIFDNLEAQQAISPYFPNPHSTAHILVTSRFDQPGFTPIPIDPLDPECSFKLLCQESCRLPEDPTEETAALEIGTILGGLPLAIELAGAYLCHRRTFTFADYLAKLREDPLKALPEKFLRSFTGHDPDLFRTLKINEELFEEEPLLTPILNLLTWSGPATMGIELMACLLGKTPAELRGAMALGVELRIIQKIQGAERYAIHRLVREVRKVEIPIAGEMIWAENIANKLGDWFQGLREEFKNLPSYEAEIDHLIAWCDNCSGLPRTNARLTWLQAYPPYHRGDYRRAHDIVKSSFSMIEKESSEPTELNAHINDDLGHTYGLIGDFKTALKLKEHALSIRLSLFGENHSDTVLSYKSVGIAYCDLGDYKKALEFHRKALNICLTLFGDKHHKTASSYDSVGTIYNYLGDCQTALELLQKSLDISRELFGEDHPATATSYNNIGNIYFSLRDYRKALEFQQKSVDIYCKLFGDNNIFSATSYNNIGNTCCASGDNKMGHELIQKALNIRQSLYGENHPDVVRSFFSLGISYYRLGKSQLAVDALNKALLVGKRILSATHPLLVDIQENLKTVQSQAKGFRAFSRKKRR
ncbi:tetratricopeptide repeat protein [Geobacter pelophilus]|uniref:Tetratricopeptide repeat protein n=1 Tax=Geoanaerobacter pelophilus TaxID=60036 RepID=A0AAW4L6K4_9BACT|nr:toll/interleukin-1 receptor domain-containing protein [Geoanaerobacter pelophilus]MBT0664210.1 tetratricopeptide repeat protein [Geoanaerobacter pelophilus]